jgi:DNA uptake protein ComE-like DNA-binding protein
LQFPPPTTATTQPATPPPYPAFAPIQVYNTNNLQGAAAATVPYPTGATSPNPMEVGYNEPKASGTPQGFPFGGFARNGEMLNIPFIGAYRIRSGTYNLTTGAFSAYNVASVVEMNALPMDCAFADDGDSALSYPPPGSGSTLAPPQTADDPYENIGRFYPTTARIQQTQSAATPPVPPTIPTTDYYFWTRRLFDYLTVQSNDNNYMPNTDPGPRDDYNAADPAPLGQQMYYAGPVTQVYNSDGSAPDQTNQDTVGVEGLININTAPASVLALLPLVTEGDEGGSSPATDCQTIANAIVTYRNANGPFMSIFDLNKVPGFQTANVKLTIGTANPQPVAAAANPIPGTDNTLTSTNGVLTPPDTAFPSVTPTASNNLSEDYESDNLVLNRISNMITTRSDTFTVYIVIEGWQNAILPGQTYTAGSNNPKPQLKVVRHYAFIADRSAINQDPSSRFLRTLTVPNN